MKEQANNNPGIYVPLTRCRLRKKRMPIVVVALGVVSAACGLFQALAQVHGSMDFAVCHVVLVAISLLFYCDPVQLVPQS